MLNKNNPGLAYFSVFNSAGVFLPIRQALELSSFDNDKSSKHMKLVTEHIS